MVSETSLRHGQVRNYIGGTWVTPSGADGRDVVDPATGESTARVQFSDTADVDDAVTAARGAFPEWSRRPVERRIQPLFRYKHLLEAHQEGIAEHRKTFDEPMGEIRRGIENVEVACGIPTMMQAGHLPNAAPGIDETAAPMAFFHFGGWKDSFFGDLHAQGEDAVRFYTDEAVYTERWPDE